MNESSISTALSCGECGHWDESIKCLKDAREHLTYTAFAPILDGIEALVAQCFATHHATKHGSTAAPMVEPQDKVKVALKEERRRIREAVQSLPNAKDVERVIFAPQTLPLTTK
jgi:hypothetical protein